jgi:hypothetical protein
MTSADWRKNWVGFSTLYEGSDDTVNDLVSLLSTEGIHHNWWSIYGSLRAISGGMGLSIDRSHVFHGSKYVGSSVEEVKTYIYTLKRIYGEI